MRALLTSLLVLVVAFTGVGTEFVSPAQAGAVSVSHMQAVIASEAIVASMADVQPAAARRSTSCSPRSYNRPPKTIRVFRIHKRGSRVPARIDTMSFRTYVGRVMAAGAWPAYKPMESLKAGAVVIAQRAWWMINHHDRRFRWRGRCFDIMPGSAPRWCSGCDAGQYYVGQLYVHSKIRRAIDAVWGTRLYKHGRFIKPPWSGDGGSCGQSVTGFGLPEDAVTACARKGWSWRRILRHYFAPVQIRSKSAAVSSPEPRASPTAVFALSLDSLGQLSQGLEVLLGYFRQVAAESVYAVNRAVS